MGYTVWRFNRPYPGLKGFDPFKLASFVQRLIGESAKAQQLELEFMASRRKTRRELSVLTLGRRILDVAPHYLHRLHPWQAISSLGTQAAFVFTVTA